jgi:1,4-dihydroxy-2-naphthoate octaprenyltransferase
VFILKTKPVLKILRLGRLKLPLIAFLLFLFGALLVIVSGVCFALDRFLPGSAMMVAAILSINYDNDYFDVARACDVVEGRDPSELLLLAKDEADRVAAHLRLKYSVRITFSSVSFLHELFSFDALALCHVEHSR